MASLLSSEQVLELPIYHGSYEVDSAIKQSLLQNAERASISAQKYGSSLWGHTAKIIVQTDNETPQRYFLKVVDLGDFGRMMCMGEYEALKEIHHVIPTAVPRPISWGRLSGTTQTYFLIEEFRDIGRQPARPHELVDILATLHKKSTSPTGKFGFPVQTCHTRVVQHVDGWDASWSKVFSRHLSHILSLARESFASHAFAALSEQLLGTVVPRLLAPLQSNGRSLKPVLLHGDCWDGNTAMDSEGNAFFFDVCSFYGHNEYDTGNWRTPRHLLSHPDYITAYKERIPPSEPEYEWDDRNRLYSLPFNIANALYIPNSTQKPIVLEDMQFLCSKYRLIETANHV